ncbi:MAG: hypothetical protein AAB916_01150 [Patescibacteria group bacterium]
MSKLDELEESLYGREDKLPTGRSKRQAMFPSLGNKLRTSWEAAKPRPSMASARRFSKATAIAALAGVLFIIGAAVFAFLYLGSNRYEAQVEIGGRDRVEAGELTTVPIMFRNVSGGVLEEADLVAMFPPDTLLQNQAGFMEPIAGRVVRRIGALAAGEERREEFQVQFFGRETEEKTVFAELVYRPAGLRARFSSSAEKKVTIARVPLAISWDIPATVTPGQEVPIILRYSSQAGSSFDNLWLMLEYPPGFSIVSAVPVASSTDARWFVGTLSPGEERTISLKTTFGTAGGDIQSLRAGIGSFNELTKEWKPWYESVREVALSSSPFLLEAAIGGQREGIVKPGDFISMTVRYRNRSAVAVKNVSIRLALETSVLDVSSLTIGDGGVFDFATKNIVWGPGGTDVLREAAPGHEGTLHLQARVRPRPVVSTSADKNMTIRMRTRIETPTVPDELHGSVLAPEDSVTFKVSTVVLTAGRTVFRTSPIPNTGPLPPKVGEKTTYAIVWEVRNFTNDVEGGEMRASLPPNVRWENVISPSDADVRFDNASGEVRWRMGRIPAGTGVLTPARVAAFQVSIIPSAVDLGSSPALIGDTHFTGRDMFTAQDVRLDIPGLDTQMPQDPLVKGEEWNVRP